MRCLSALLLVAISPVAFAAQRLEELCPATGPTLAHAAFPASAPKSVERGTVNVEFTVQRDGSVVDPVVLESSDDVFNEPAMALIAELRCTPSSELSRFRLPVTFIRSQPISGLVCPNYRRVMKDITYPRDAMQRGLNEGSVLIEFTLRPDGTVPEYRVLRMTDEAFAKAALLGLVGLRCTGQAHDVKVRVPFDFVLK